jgi:hypothetical protein
MKTDNQNITAYLPYVDHYPTPPLFILSCERSGSTLLRYIVDTHPEISAPGQLYLGRLCQDLYTAAYYSLGQHVGESDEGKREAIAIEKVRCIVMGLMEEYIGGKHKRIWCEKSTDNINHLDILSKAFPQAKYICLYRHCMDVVHSCIECSRLRFMPELSSYVQKNPENIVAAMISNWIEKNLKLLEFEEKNHLRCFRLSYEDLVMNPNKTLQDLFFFLEVGWDEGLLNSVFTQPHDQGIGDMKVLLAERISTESIGKGMVIPRTSIPAKLLPEMNNLLKKLGYQSIGAEYDTGWSYGCLTDTVESDVAGQMKTVFKSRFPSIIQNRCKQAKTLNGICKFAVSGEGGGIWRVDLTKPEVLITAGDGKTDCTIAVSSLSLLKILDGRLNVIDAIQNGELGAMGNMELAKKFGQLLLKISE